MRQTRGRGTGPVSLQKEFTIRNAKSAEDSRVSINCFPPTHTMGWLVCRTMSISIRVFLLLDFVLMEKL